MKNKIAIKFLTDTNKEIKVYTTRPDLIYGVTFILIPSNKNKFTNTYAINPLNNKKIPIYESTEVKNNHMGVPYHNHKDYLFALEHKIEMIQVIEEITGTPNKDEFTKKSIVAIVYNPHNKKYLTINWHDKGGRLFIGGTIKEQEEPLTCALREIKEETGYYNLELLRTLPLINHHYYAYNKNKYFNIECTGFLFSLKDETKYEQNLDEDEVFSVEWVNKTTALKEIKDGLHHKTFTYSLTQKPITTNGIHINSDILNGLNKEEAILKISEWLKHNN